MNIAEAILDIPVAEGRTLSARLWRPLENGRWPAVLDASPYRVGDLFRSVVERDLAWIAAHGYATLAIDIAGSGNSRGLLADEYTAGEIGDLLAAVAWAEKQPWCDGNVGLSGFSWGAFAALRASVAKPDALRAMVLGGVSEDGWHTDIHYLGGALYTAHVDWAGVMFLLNALPPDPAVFGGDWRTEWLARLQSNAPWITAWLTHAAHDSYWSDKQAKLADAPRIPLLLYGGTADKYATSVLRMASSWPGPVRTIIGPWEHARPNVAARAPRIGHLQESLKWWDAFLKRRNGDVLAAPDLRLWLAAPDSRGEMSDGEWIAADLRAERAAALRFAVRDRRLTRDAAPGSRPILLSRRRANPRSLNHDLYEDVPAPFDLRGAEALGAVVALSEPMEGDRDIGLTPVLACRSPARSGIVVARLVDVAPDGTSIRMTTGAANLAYARDDRIEIPLQATCWRLRRGHRLALVLSADGWPTFWPGLGADALPLSSLSLSVPLVQRLPAAVAPFEEAVTHEVAAPQKLKWIDPARERLRASAPDAVSLEGRDAAFHLAATGTDYFVTSRFDLAAGAGDFARAQKHYRARFERPGWSIGVDTALEVSSDSHAFHVAWRIEAREGGEVIYLVERSVEIPRKTV